MKTIISLITLYLLFILNAFSQAPAWDWVREAGDLNYQAANGVLVDHSGAIVATGYYEGFNITFGSTILSQSLGSTGMFLVKYDSYGNVVWAKRGGGTGANQKAIGTAVAFDTWDNLVVTGGFSGPTTVFGSTTLVNDTPYGGDVFIVKYDSSGNVLWAKRAGGKLSDSGQAVASDAWGNIYLAGLFESNSIIFGNDTLFKANQTDPWGDMFLAKYDSAGNVLWSRGMGNDYKDIISSVAIDNSGNIFITGGCGDTIDFGNGIIIGGGAFIAKYDSGGTALWARNSSGGEAYSLVVDASGNAVITGIYSGNSITFDTTVLANAGAIDFFIAKYDDSGNLLWAKSAGSDGYDASNCITTDQAGNYYVTGSSEGTNFSNSVVFGQDSLYIYSNMRKPYIVKYDSNGNILWAASTSFNPGHGFPESIAIDASNNLYMAGEYRGQLTFGSTAMNNPDNDNVLIAKLGTDPVSIDEFEGARSINICPNPANNIFRINVPPDLFNTQLEIFDCLGKNVYSEKLNSDLIYFKGSPGIYFVRLIVGDMLYSKKLVIQ